MPSCEYLGLALQDQGDLDGAIACYRRALELKPDSVECITTLEPP